MRPVITYQPDCRCNRVTVLLDGEPIANLPARNDFDATEIAEQVEKAFFIGYRAGQQKGVCHE